MAVGDFLIRRNDALTDVLPNAGTNLDAAWDAERFDEGSPATYSAGTFTLVDAAPYLVFYSEEFSTTNTTNNERIEGQGRLLVGGSEVTEGAAEGYIRKSSGQQEMVIGGATILRTTSANQTLETRFYRGDNSTSGTVNRVPGRGGVHIVQLDDSDAFARYSTTAAQNIIQTEGNVTNWQNDEEDAGFSRSGDTVTITNAGRYVMAVSGIVSITGTSRTEAVVFAENGTTEIEGARGHTHMRGADGNQNGAFNFAVIIDVAASDTITLRSDLNAGSTPSIASGMTWQFWRLPAGADTAIMEATNGNMNASGDFTWDTLPHIDTASFTATLGTANIDVDQQDHLLCFWQMGKRTVDSVQRAYPVSQPAVDGEVVNYAAGGSYHRNSGGVGAFMSHGGSAVLPNVASGAEITINIEPLGASGTLDCDTGHFSLLSLASLYTYVFPPSVTAFPATFDWGDADLTITGTNFGATQGTGKVEFWDDLAGTTKTVQTIDSWSDTSIQIDTVQGSLPSDATVYLVVTSDAGSESSPRATREGLETYEELLAGMGVDHYWKLNNAYDDTGDTGPARDMTSGVVGTFTFGSPIRDGNTHSLTWNSVTQRREIADSSNMNIGTTQTERTVGCWIQLGGIQHPLAAIWKEGGGVQNLAFLVGYGNVLLAQLADVASTRDNVQAVSDIRLTPNRPYCIVMRYSNTENPSEFLLYLDGEEQSVTDGNPMTINIFDSHSGDVVWGDPDANLETGGTDISYNGPNDMQLSDFFTFSDNSGGPNAGGLDPASEIRDKLFRRGAPPDDILTSDTEANMQVALDATADARPDWPLSYRVFAQTGGGALELVLTDKVFDDRITAHLEWRGSGVLTLVNSGTSNIDASKCYSSGSGSIVVVNEVPVQVLVSDIETGLPVEGARVRFTSTGGPLPAGTVVVEGNTDSFGLVSTDLRYSADQPIEGRVRKGSSSTFYQTTDSTATIGSSGLTLQVFLIRDE